MSPALLLGLNLLVFGTFAVFGENQGEFLVSYQHALQNYYLPALAIFLIFVLPPMFFGHRVSRAYNAVLILLGVLTYIHGSVILWNTGVLDGTHLDLSKTWRSVVDALLWVTLAWAAFRYRSWLLLHGWKICVALILFQTIGVLFVLSHGQDKNQTLVVGFPKELAAFSLNSNVIHIILDGYQASVFEQLLTEQPGLANDFSGFTFFRDASTSSAITYLSVPAALSGTAFKNDQLISAYQEQALRGHNLFSFLADNGYSLDVATPAWWNKPNDLFASYYRIPEPYADEHGTLFSTALLLADISLYRQTPHFLKSTIYRSGAWLLSGWLVATPEQQFDHFAHTAFFMDLIDKLTVAPSGPRYKFIHLVTPHAPLVTLADCSFAGASLEYSHDAFVQQSRCTLKNLVSFLKKLKISGVYDNSLLIVHGDHGGGVPFDMVGENGVKTNSTEALSHMWGNPLPLVLIKPRFESGKLKISNQPVELLDLPSTVAHQLGLDGNFPGHSMFEKNGKDVIPRYYYQSTIRRNEAAAKDYFEDFSTYLISGSIYATSSWHEAGFYAAPVTDSADHYRWTAKITFGRRGNSRPFQESGWGLGTAPLVTWTAANKAKLSILFSDIDSPVTMRVKLKPFLVPGKLDKQRVNIFFGNTLVGTWSLTVNRFQTVELTIPKEMFNLAGKTAISFELPDAKSPKSLGAKAGKSSLALAFFFMEFEKQSTANEQ